ncbi:head-tail connector protein [Streptomyces sp. NPDC002838]|uniref:head-tail connector protein n=1 Tax=Streptomyces sp. NPDC002838 TaxID=3154436 RepID=UPI00332738CB
MAFDLGAVVPLGTTVTDAAGNPANAGSMAVTITLPDRTSTTVSPVTPTSTGVYAYDYPTVQAGRHTVRWVATGVNAGAYTDMFDVREAAPPALMSLETAKRHLKKTDNTDDDEIRDWIEACTRAIEQFTGPVVVRSVTEVMRFTRARSIALTQTPAIELTSAVATVTGGTSYAVADLDLDGETGIVTKMDGGVLYGPLRMVYVVGRVVVGANIRSAGKIILQHLWRTRQGPGRPQRGTDDFDVTEPLPGLGFAIPNRAVQLLDPDSLPPGVG